MKFILVAHGRDGEVESAKSTPAPVRAAKTEIRVAVLAALLDDEAAIFEAALQSGLTPDVVRRALRALAQSA